MADLKQLQVTQKNPCIILTNTECNTHKSQCDNFSRDQEIITKTFSELNFEVNSKENMKGDDIASQFWKLKTIDYSLEDCLVCFVLSCGGLSGDLGVIYGSDGKHYSVDTMIAKVNHNPTLRGKPKLFFMVLNRCSRSVYKGAVEHVEASGGEKTGKSKAADTFIYYIMLENGK